MALNHQTMLLIPLFEEDLPEGVMFVHPEDPPGQEDELALHEFLREFENDHEHMEIVGLFPVDQDE